MRSELSAKHYSDPAVLEQEQVNIFRRLWIFAGLRTALAVPNAFITRQIGGLPVLVQNCNGEIRAFSNQCPHRLMPLQLEEFGQARMVCPYHGWTFDHQGKVKAIPHEASMYQYTPEEREALCLPRYAVRIVGSLVFVNLSPGEPLPIEAQFTPELLAHLENVTGHFGAQAVHVNIPARYNWKFQYENVLDYNHVPYIHPKTFQPLLAQKTADNAPLTMPPALPVQEAQVRAATRRRILRERPDLHSQSFLRRGLFTLPQLPWQDKVRRYEAGAGCFDNMFLFPNVNFYCAEGVIFKIEQYDPVAADATQVRFTLAIAQETEPLPNVPAVLHEYLQYDVGVLHEDMFCLEAMQASLHAASPPAQHGRYEQQLIAFAHVYQRLLAGERLW